MIYAQMDLYQLYFHFFFLRLKIHLYICIVRLKVQDQVWDES